MRAIEPAPEMETAHERASELRLRVAHVVRYRFEGPVAGVSLRLRMTPRAVAAQWVLAHALVVEPEPAVLEEERDAHGNVVHTVRIATAVRAFSLQATSVVARTFGGVPPGVRAACAQLLERAGVRCEARPARAEGERGPARAGACRAATEATLVRLRACGIASRYLGGYACAHGIDGIVRTLPHAWLALDVPACGSVELDPLSGELAPAHVLVAWGDGYADVAPVTGSLLGSGRFRLTSSVTLERLPDLAPS